MNHRQVHFLRTGGRGLGDVQVHVGERANRAAVARGEGHDYQAARPRRLHAFHHARRAAARRNGYGDVAGPPKRFAQGMGAAITTLGVVALVLGWSTVTAVLLAALVVAATLEAALGLCIGCKVFAGLMRAGIVPETVCVECADISARLQRA